MNIEEFTLIFSYLSKAYNKDIDKSQLKIWYDFFKTYTIQEVKNAVIQCINESKYFPSIAELKSYITKQNNSQVNLKADEEWEKVRDVASRIGRYREEEALSYLEPITRNIVRRIGFQDICNADEYSRNNLRNAFIKSFESEKDDLIRYEKSNNKDTAEMSLIYQRNSDFLDKSISGLIKRIEDVKDGVE